MRRIILFMFFSLSIPSIHSHNWSLELFFGTLTNVAHVTRKRCHYERVCVCVSACFRTGVTTITGALPINGA